MGSLDVSVLNKKKDKAHYIHQLLKDIEALDIMIEQNLIEKSPIRIGAEQEFCLVDYEFMPQKNSLQVLDTINDEHFTTEIGQYNLEINSDPVLFEKDCFSKLHKQLKELLTKAKNAAAKHDTRICLTGVLPTLRIPHVSEEYMTKIKRYAVLNEALKDSRGQDFYIHIKGVDELNFLSDSVMLEACNTSFQTHLQVNPDNFIDTYNWAQAISGPVLSACTNSPLLFGKGLWAETRIALFNQSVDTRANSFVLNEKQSRVSFGSHWEKGTVSSIFKDNISKFRSLLTSEFEGNSVEVLKSGTIPKLKALNLHNGTVYRWNRVCYGVGGGKPHLRIECRYLPSGPTLTDEIANMMFWVGLVVGQSKEYENIQDKMDFKDVRSNFYKACRYGVDSILTWNGKKIAAKDLILDELLPMAYRGLYKAGILPEDVEYYLTIIENRLKSWTGSEWMVKSYRNLQKSKKPFEALQVLTSYMYEKQEHDYPVDSWTLLEDGMMSHFNIKRIVKHNMNAKIFSVGEKDSLELVLHIMKWNNIHHMPVINNQKEIIGILSWKDIQSVENDTLLVKQTVKELMNTTIISVRPDQTIQEAKDLMKRNNISCLPVIYKGKLVGIITSNDI
jgi:predicted transcriptional regulator